MRIQGAMLRPSQSMETRMSFRILGLSPEPFAGLFTLSDAELAACQAVRQIVDAPNSFPCRVSLTDAVPGDAVVLTNYEHLPVATPYRSRHAIFVRAGEQQYDAVDAVPEQLRRRILAVRAFDEAGMIVGAELVDGTALEGAITQLFTDGRAAYLHAHFAKYGCYAARIERV
jgi:hypothetical protein